MELVVEAAAFAAVAATTDTGRQNDDKGNDNTNHSAHLDIAAVFGRATANVLVQVGVVADSSVGGDRMEWYGTIV